MESTPLYPKGASSKRGAVQQYMRKYWFDWAVLAVIGGVSMGTFFAPPLSKRLFAVSYEGQPLDFDYAYPVLDEIVPTWMAGVIAGSTGVIVLAIAQIWVRSVKDFHRALLCMVTCLLAASWFQVICKIMIGGFRPNFFEVCKPDISQKEGSGYWKVYYDHTICTGDQTLVNDALESFPSGHSTVAFAGNLFVSLYLNAKLKLWGGEYAPVWKLFLVFAPLLVATLLSLCRLVDYTHHWYDITAGAIIGIMFTFATYRMHYRSIFDPATNHLLLPRKKKTHSKAILNGDFNA